MRKYRINLKTKSKKMKKFGIALISLGVFCVLLAFDMNVSIGTIYNIGLLNERQNIIFISGIIFLAGIILLGFGCLSENHKSQNINKFIFYCLLPILLFLIFKIMNLSIKTYAEQQETTKKKLETELKEEQEIKQKALELEKIRSKLETDFNKKFVDNDDGTVTYKKTNLIFQKCSLGQEWKYSTCMSIDNVPVKVTLASTKSNKYAVELFKSGWRIPTKEELSLIIYCSDNMQDKNGNCLSGRNQNGFSDMGKVFMEKIDSPTINKLIFPNAPSGFYLTSSLLENNNVWHINFEHGYIISRDIDSTAYVRLVRNGK